MVTQIIAAKEKEPIPRFPLAIRPPFWKNSRSFRRSQMNSLLLRLLLKSCFQRLAQVRLRRGYVLARHFQSNSFGQIIPIALLCDYVRICIRKRADRGHPVESEKRQVCRMYGSRESIGQSNRLESA